MTTNARKVAITRLRRETLRNSRQLDVDANAEIMLVLERTDIRQTQALNMIREIIDRVRAGNPELVFDRPAPRITSSRSRPSKTTSNKAAS